MTDYKQHRAKKMRLMILRWLREGQSFTMDIMLLQSALAQQGVNAWDDELREELKWLEGEKLAKIREEMGQLIAELTPAGLDIAEGRARHKQIDRPRPGHLTVEVCG